MGGKKLKHLLGEVQRIRIIAPGRRTLFLNGRIPSRFGSSTDSAIICNSEQKLKTTETKKKKVGRSGWETEAKKKKVRDKEEQWWRRRRRMVNIFCICRTGRLVWFNGKRISKRRRLCSRLSLSLSLFRKISNLYFSQYL